MDIIQSIRNYAAQPITHQLLMALLRGYKRPNDKIHALLKDGILSALKRGVYIAGPQLANEVRPEPFLVANHLLGPSYVSLDTALSFHGLIPERVYEITSVTTKYSRSFSTPMGLFSYIRLELPYYTFGIQRVKLTDEQFAMIASPEKSLFDKIVTTSGVILRSVKAAESYLLENLRMDEDKLKALDIAQMASWLDDAPKKDSLSHVVKMIENL
jgi:predicted transcriptional regulator of viral defense system